MTNTSGAPGGPWKHPARAVGMGCGLVFRRLHTAAFWLTVCTAAGRWPLWGIAAAVADMRKQTLMCRVSDDGPIMSRSTITGAVVRKPSGKEPAGCGGQRWRTLYGDFDAAVEDSGADDVAGGAIVERRDGGDEVRVARQRECEADLGVAECGLGQALLRPAADQRDRSALQRRMLLLGLMRCRS
jgi:hypothetical protein